MKTTSAIGSDARPHRAGFTLIEMSIAVFIIAIIIAVAMPNFVRSYNAALLNATGRTLATNCEFAKLNAVLHQQRVACYIDMDKQTVWLMQFTTAPDADNVQPQSQILKTIEINPRIALRGAERGSGLEVVVDPVTCRGMLWPIKL